MNLEIITKDGKDYALLPFEEYQKLLEDVEMLADIRAYDEIKNNNEETFPAQIVYQMTIEGQNPIKVFREYRNLTPEALADQVGVSPVFIWDIEEGKNTASLDMLTAIAIALNVDIDLII